MTPSKVIATISRLRGSTARHVKTPFVTVTIFLFAAFHPAGSVVERKFKKKSPGLRRE